MLTDRGADSSAAKLDMLSASNEVATRNRGLQILCGHLTELTDLVVASLHASEPTYRSSVPPGELQMAKSINEVLKGCGYQQEDRERVAGWPREIGRRRAHQGVPLESMHRAYHIGGQVLFSAFVKWADEEGLSRERSINLADDLWDVVDLHCTSATNAFRETEDEMSGGRGGQAGQLLDALFSGDADRDGVAAVTRAWGLAEQARYAVVVQRPADWGTPPLEQAELPARAAGVRLMWRIHAGCAIGLVVLGEAPVAAVAAALPARSGRRTGVSLVVDSLAEIGRARRLAELAARTVTSSHGGVACLEERLPAALLTARPDLASELCVRVLAPVLALDRVSRDLLLDTFAAWLNTGGSAHRAATTLFCHRNTVLNRMRRLERLTKRSLSVPEDLIELTLALEAFQIRAVRS